MDVFTVSQKFQVVIPQRVRDSLGLRPGEKMQVVLYGDRVELIPQRPARALRGSLRGIDSSIPREGGRA
jgi:AbrB family looped-hinge helix DNA binding protein